MPHQPPVQCPPVQCHNDRPFTLCTAGHREAHPGRPKARLSDQVDMLTIAQMWLHRHPPEVIITGLALGWDTAVALTGLNLGLPVICAIPFPNQPSRWPPADVQVWKRIQAQATEVHIISPDFSPEAFQARNEWMVDHSDYVLALWSGRQGGTANCLRYAHTKRKPVKNLWFLFKDYQVLLENERKDD